MIHRTESSPDTAFFSTSPLQAGGEGEGMAKVRVGPTLTTSPLVHFFKEEEGVLTSSLQFHEVHFLFRLENKTKPASECTLSSVPGISSNFL